MRVKWASGFSVGVILITGGCALSAGEAPAALDNRWRPLFDGRTLEGWTPKIRGYELGENYRDTFIVRDGAIRVSYDRYSEFGSRFGHLFHETPVSAFRLRLEYRFLGDGPSDTPGWARYNSGVMIFSQAPESMARDQGFPVSVEAQLLAADGSAPRANGNVCTPGTDIVMEGRLIKQHCINSPVAARPADGRWILFEIEVSPSGLVTQRIDGEVSLVYSSPQLDPKADMADSLPLIAAAGGRLEMKGGYLSLQSEGAPIEFRNIEIMDLGTLTPPQVANARPTSE
ncbi:MAG: DUF1080 domain-containing protein [Alphaproteobacteria bacterium]|nr:DUF1080 domain-containing protein [Alphaproteobacteria bacterium]